MKKTLQLLSAIGLIILVGCQTTAWENVTKNYFPEGKTSGMEVYQLVQHMPDSLRGYYFTFSPTSSDYSVECLVFDTLTTLSDYLTACQSQGINVLAVVNGGYFSFSTQKSLSLLIHDRITYAENMNTVVRNDRNYYPTRGAFAIDTTGIPFVGWVSTRSGQTYWYSSPSPNDDTATPLPVPVSGGKIMGVEEAIGGGPLLVYEGEKVANLRPELFSQTYFSDKRHPRTAIGIKEDGELVLMLIEGRRVESVGASCDELAGLLQDVGCEYALNLDGGGSSYGFVNNKPLNRSSDMYSPNTPAGEIKERSVSTVIALIKKK